MTVPLILTFIRLVCSVTVLPYCLYYYFPLNFFWINKLLALFISILALTDFFDGFLARRWGQWSLLGEQLDPLADKLLFSVPLIMLWWFKKISLVWVIILVSRELLVSCMRFYTLKVTNCHSKTLNVSTLSKWKSTFQYIYLILMIGAPWRLGGELVVQNIFLYCVVVLSLVSMCYYLRNFFKKV